MLEMFSINCAEKSLRREIRAGEYRLQNIIKHTHGHRNRDIQDRV